VAASGGIGDDLGVPGDTSGRSRRGWR
jgi:hypothetical protein